VLVFTLLGAAAALVGFALRSYQQWLARLAGLLLILFGIALTGLVPIPWVSMITVSKCSQAELPGGDQC
jgi:cytochrome c-type biogenesis protein